MIKLRYRQAVLQALRDEMERDPSVILMGEDVAEAGGVFKTSEGLLDELGAERVRDTPISEMGFVGAAVGAATTGLRPVVEIMFVEFLGVALDQLVTQAAKLRYLSRGEVTVPMVVRASSGAGLGFGAQHSQVLDHWFRATPGLKVCAPATPQAAYGLLRAAIRDDDPVLVLETRSLYGDRAEVITGPDGVVPLGRAEIRRSGEDITILSLGQMVKVASEAADRDTGWDAEVIDLQTLVPWDRQTVLESVSKTGRLAIVEEAPYSGGWGHEVADEVSGELFGQLRAPVLRITCPNTPVPFPADLEARFLPTADYVSQQVDELISTASRPRPWWQAEGVKE